MASEGPSLELARVIVTQTNHMANFVTAGGPPKEMGQVFVGKGERKAGEVPWVSSHGHAVVCFCDFAPGALGQTSHFLSSHLLSPRATCKEHVKCCYYLPSHPVTWGG